MLSFDISPIIVDGILNLHSKLNNAFVRAQNLQKLYGIAENVYSDRFQLLVDFSEDQPSNQIKGYLLNSKVIYRFISITFDIALLFPVYDHRTGEKLTKGLTFAEIQSLFQSREKVRLNFRLLTTKNGKPFFDCRIKRKDDSFAPVQALIDDLGAPFFDFSSIESLNLVDIPSSLNVSYSLVGLNYHAPYTKEECFCVLYAQNDNEFDDYAVKVLRWFPMPNAEALQNISDMAIAKEKSRRLERSRTKYTEIMLETCGTIKQSDEGLISMRKKHTEVKAILEKENLSTDIFYDMGYISRQENRELHNFMMSNNSRLLFAKKSGASIQILGGIKYLISSGFNFPRCLAKIKIL